MDIYNALQVLEDKGVDEKEEAPCHIKLRTNSL